MKITKVEPIVLVVPQSMGFDEDDIVDVLIVRVETDEGIYGLGETAGPTLSLVPMVRSVHQGTWYRGFEDLLVGENPLEIERLWQKMYTYSLHYGARGLIVWLISAIDIALWDIAGKYYNKPVYKLLGREEGGSLPAYASLPAYDTAEQVVAACEEMIGKYHFKALKFHTDWRHAERLYDGTWVRFVKVVREHFGEGLTIMIDVHNWFETDDAIRFARSLEPYNPYFLEAALNADNLDGYAKLHDSTKVKIAAGEELTTRFMYLDLMDRGKVDVVQFDATLGGGITDGKKVGDLARARGRIMIPHCWHTDISFAANLHMAGGVGSSVVEWPIAKSPLRNELTREKFTLDQEGRVALPERPGLGVTLDEKIVERFLYRGPFAHY